MTAFRCKLLLLNCLMVCLPALIFAGPQIACEDSVFDFGTVHTGSMITNTFLIKNVGDETLQIGKIRACCGAKAHISGKVIEPETNVVLKVVLSLRNRRGKQNKRIYVASNDPKQPFAPVTLKGEVLAPVYMKPSYVKFGKVKPDEKVQAEFVLNVLSGINCSITNVMSDSKYFEATYYSCPTSNLQKVKVSTKGILPLGVIRGRVKIYTDHPKYKKLRARVSAIVAGDLVVVPYELLLKAQGGELKPVKRFVSVRSRTREEFSIKNVLLPDEKMISNTKTMSSGGYIIEINGITPFPSLNESNVVIQVDHNDVDKVEIPIRIVN